jgi:hypothetical protein
MPQSSVTQIFVKDLVPKTITLLGDEVLADDETFVSCSLSTLSPTTSPPLALVGSPTFAGDFRSVAIDLTGGTLGTTYAVNFELETDAARTVIITAAVLVQQNLIYPYTQPAPSAFQTLIDSIQAGDAASGKAFFILPTGSTPAASGYVTWDLVDVQGTVLAMGNAYDYVYTAGSFSDTVEANAVIAIPSTVPPTEQNSRYQLRWTLNIAGAAPIVSYENIRVLGLGNSEIGLGSPDLVEILGDIARAELIVDRPFPVVSLELYQFDTKVFGPLTVPAGQPVSSGWHYATDVSLDSVFAASLDPYSVIWRCGNNAQSSSYSERVSSKLFVVSPSMLQAVDDIRSFVAKSRSTLRVQHDIMFDHATVMTWLRRGRDWFNAAGGIVTEFNMTRATGAMREFWLRYAEVAALQAQYLAEGEKTFEFSGQDITLSVDHAQYYESMANTIRDGITDAVKDFKKFIQIKGVSGGDGDMTGISAGTFGHMGGVGLSRNVLSPRFPGPNNRYNY